MINPKFIKKYYDKRSACQVLGILMKEPHRVQNQDYSLSEKDFSSGLHEVIFICIYNLANQDIKEITIGEIEGYLASTNPISYKKIFDNNENTEWLHGILQDANSPNYTYYYNKVKKMSLLRSYLEQGINISDILNIDEIDPVKRQQQQEKFENMTIEDIVNLCDKKILLAKKNFVVKNDSESRKAGEDAEALYFKMKDSPSYGLGLESEYLNTITRAMQKKKFYLETRDSGCVDCDTEYFNGFQWVKISNYKNNDKVLQYNKDGTAELVNPLEYHKHPAEYLWHFKTERGINQCLSDEHDIVYINDRNLQNMELVKEPFKQFKDKHNQLKGGHKGKIITTFKYDGEGIDLSDEQIRVMVAIIADGSFVHEYKDRDICKVNLKKARKKERLEKILHDANIEYEKRKPLNGYQMYIFKAPRIERSYTPYWYKCNKKQLEIIADEVLHWDGCTNNRRCFCTTVKESADFVQFVFSSLGQRATIMTYNRVGRQREIDGKIYTTKSIDYVVIISSQRPLIGIFNNKKKVGIQKYKTLDGYKYCFTVPSGMLVLRRGDKIFITGNSGKSRIAIKRLLNATAPYIWDFEKKDFIKNPNGVNNCALYIGTEMDLYEEIEPMMWAFISGVEEIKIKDCTLTKEEDNRIKKAIEILQNTQLYQEHNPNFSVSYLWKTIEDYKKQHDIVAVGLDYIELNPSLIGEYTNNTKGMGVREDQVLLDLSTNLKNIAEDIDVFMMAFTQTTDEARRDGIRDQRAVKGARSLPNKADVGVVVFEPTKKELGKIDAIVTRKGIVRYKTPNICHSFYKLRGGIQQHKDIKVWGYQDLGTMEYVDMFCTDKDYKLVNVNPTKIEVQDDKMIVF